MDTIDPKYLKPQPTIEQARERLTAAGIEYSREDFMNKKRCSYFDYMDQFVTDAVVSYVERAIGKTRILNSTDEYLNDIPLAEWDRASEFMPQYFWWNIALSNMFTQNHSTAVPAISPSDKVSLLKQAARRLKQG